jgi:hypothetical protein
VVVLLTGWCLLLLLLEYHCKTLLFMLVHCIPHLPWRWNPKALHVAAQGQKLLPNKCSKTPHSSGRGCVVVVLGHFKAVHPNGEHVDGIGGLPGAKVCLRAQHFLHFMVALSLSIANHWHQLVNHELVTIMVDEQVDLE